MIDDYWSLKGLKQKKIDYVDRSIDIPYEIYNATAIKTLRELIIHDIKTIQDEYDTWYKHASLDMIVDDIERAINKRFGYE